MEPTLPYAEAVRLQNSLMPRRVQLPVELLLQIVDEVVSQTTNALLPASHTVTKTLLSLTRTCHAIHRRARKLVQEHCVVLDTKRRLAYFLRYLKEADGDSALPRDTCFSARHVPAMYLAPFFRAEDDEATASQVTELLGQVSGTLRRLVMRMPFSPLHREDKPVCVCRTLHKGFAQLGDRLEEFVCLNEFPGLDLTTRGGDIVQTPPTTGGYIWPPIWPRLRRLSLFGVELDDERLWESMAMMSQLTDVVLARPTHAGAVNIKREYFDAGAKTLSAGQEFDPGRRLIRLMLMDVMFDTREVHIGGWEEIDPQDVMTVEMYVVPTSYYGDETAQATVASWVTRGARSGQIWDWRGDGVFEG